jgi:hypothetical protein
MMALWNEELTTGCFARAKKDEPMFVLLARDRLAPWLVRGWALLRTLQIWIGTKPASDFERCDEARALAEQMRAWRKANRPKKPSLAMTAGRVTFPPDGLRYGSPRDLELTRRDEQRRERFCAWLRSLGAAGHGGAR